MRRDTEQSPSDDGYNPWHWRERCPCEEEQANREEESARDAPKQSIFGSWLTARSLGAGIVEPFDLESKEPVSDDKAYEHTEEGETLLSDCEPILGKDQRICFKEDINDRVVEAVE